MNSPLSNHRLPGMEDVGRRITMRIEDESGAHDLVGVLVTPTTVRKKDGSIKYFEPATIRTWRWVTQPSRKAGTGAPLSMRIRQIDDACVSTSAPHGIPPIEIEAALQHIRQSYQDHDLPCTVQVSLPIHREVDEFLAVNGWSLAAAAKVLVADAADLMNTPPRPDIRVTVLSAPATQWLELPPGGEDTAHLLRHQARYAHLYIGEVLVAGGRIAFSKDWGVISRVGVTKSHQATGVGREVILALATESIANSCPHLVVQADVRNINALSLYQSLGFRFHHEYHLRCEPTKDTTPSAECHE